MIIGITGKAGSGKDTVAFGLANIFRSNRDTLAAPIKRFVSDVFRIPWEVADGTTPEGRIEREKELLNWPGWTTRRLLQYVGTELMRNNIDKDIWVKSIILRIKERLKEDPTLVCIVPDIRFPNEMQKLRDEFGESFKMVRVVRMEKVKLNGIQNHESEAYEIEGDFVITNNGTLAELERKIVELAETLKKGQDET